MKSSFDEHLSAVISGTEKTAGFNNTGDDSLLSKLAAEVLGVEEQQEAAMQAAESADAVAKAAEAPGATAKASSGASEVETGSSNTATGASAEMQAATDAVVTPAVATAGGDPASVEQGHAPAPVTDSGNPETVGTGDPADAKQKKEMHTMAGTKDVNEAKETTAPAMASKAAKAAKSAGVPDEQVKEASLIGDVIAESFVNGLEKQAADSEYTEALGMLKEAGLLDSYNIEDEGLEKSASYESDESGLEKIAANQELTRQDIVTAAGEYEEIVKTASQVDEQARLDARAAVEEEAEKIASVEEQARADAQADAEQEYEKQASEQEQMAKVASENPDVKNALKVLRDNGLI